MTFIPVIVSGGAGSRLWPLSRDSHPKPYMTLPQGGTLIGRTCRRAAALPDVGRIITVTHRDLLFLTADAYAAAGVSGVHDTYLLEPFGRDTSGAVAVAALHGAAEFGDKAELLVLAADHIIEDEAAFAAAVVQAREHARQDRIATFGITPDRPETGYGYIEADGKFVKRFVEKPDAQTATRYVESGRFFWNAGIFCFRAGTMIDAMARYCPDILDGARAALATARRSEAPGRTVVEIDAEAFSALPSRSVDYAVMEKAGNVACVPVDCGWSDVGSWSTMADFIAPDADGNRTAGETVLHDAVDNYVHSEDRLVALVGVSGLLVIDTPDALLVAHKDKAQQVRAVYDQLKRQGHEAVRLHRTAHRPWGTYTVLEEQPGFKIKRIVVKPGQRLSLQAHHHRSEHWIVVSGTAKVVNGDSELLVTTNQSTYIPCGHRHRLENPGILPLVLIEVQSGAYLGEDDIIRFDDVYGRN